MVRPFWVVLLLPALLGLATSVVVAHHGRHKPPRGAPSPPLRWIAPEKSSAQNTAGQKTTGKGELRFRHHPLDLPASFRNHLAAAHGGFAIDPEDSGGDGSTYFCLKGVGLLRLTPDLSRLEIVGGDASFRNVNVHNACLFRRAQRTFLALPSDEAQRVFITSTSGELVRILPNPYGDSGPAFRVCDVEFLEGLLYAVNGYADNVCFTSNPFEAGEEDPLVGRWGELRFGGKGTAHGQFGTAHGITRVPGTNVLTIADRANSRLETVSPQGRFIAGLELPAGCLPCDVDYHGALTLVGCLKGPGGHTPAPIYILRDGNIASELKVVEDLGLAGFTHIHNATFRVIQRENGTEQLFVLVYAWNPGNFAILEQVLD